MEKCDEAAALAEQVDAENPIDDETMLAMTFYYKETKERELSRMFRVHRHLSVSVY